MSTHPALHAWRLILQDPSALLEPHELLSRHNLCGSRTHRVSSDQCNFVFYSPPPPKLHQQKSRTREVLFWLTDVTRLQLNSTYDTPTAEDGVSHRMEIPRRFRELAISVWRGAPFIPSAKWTDFILHQLEKDKHKHTLRSLLLFSQLFSRPEAGLSHPQSSRTEATGNKNVCFSSAGTGIFLTLQT